ncbi:cyanophycin synthetase [Thermomonas sp.]|jgi:cyanophycin synthetase|uniref:cyanophycin synthetase n=1 Tax=Thermomonas sp. TaxID=1971895 RepID=UPI001B4731A2|nr:cyanophycin synthetase [Thermomonas sp.]MBK6415941.1 cyanophycin synthetase [Thermomonas sp.]MBK6925505.1 cyanophycin synthetase [Thermomonas sp.]MBL0228185.1 cyanophycin synthetase [Thermomonas sp.]MBP6438090.1 cyanophycin synthetase [Thermomonas sp.]MBP7157373.1 cyanophycin synthetase [Thermomonas sp.]
MRILNRNVYVGPSHYAKFPVIRLELDLGALEQWPTGKLGNGFIDGLLVALPGLSEHGCSYREPGGFIRRMREGEGTWLGHVLEHVAIELQNVAGEDVTFGKTRSISDDRPGVYSVVYEYAQREEGIAAGELALKLLDSLLPADLRTATDDSWNWEEERDGFIRYAQRRALGPSTMSLVRAAEERGIPWLRLNQQSLVQLGHGKYQQRIQATVTGRTPHIAVELASDKEETNKILGSLGLPVPRQELVTSQTDALKAARRLGGPVVLKPYNGNHGRGITINVTGEDEIRAGFEAAREHSRSVIVETYLAGDDHRLLVVNGELIAATRRTPGHVVGDGRRTVAELVEVVNSDPRRGVGHEKVLTKLKLDREAELMLERKGYTADSVPPAGETVPLRSTANLSTGGTATDVTDIIHPDNRAMAERAVRAVGLDVGGVDFLSTNIAESYKSIGGGICEVNAAPGFRMHIAPSEGTPRDAAGPVIDMLFPPGTPSRVPIAAVTGTNGKTTTARMLAHIAKMAGYTPGLTTTDGVYIDGARTVEGDMTGPVSARMVLADPQIDLAVLETARGGLVRSGMGVGEVDVGAVINVASDHLGLKGIDTLEQLAEVKRIVVEVARECAVLNADDPNVMKMSAYTDAKVICYVTMNPSHPLVREHIRAGGRACALEAGVNGHMITLYDKGSHIPLLWTHLIPATLEGRAMHNVQNAMVAAAMAFSLGIKLDAIRHGLRTFDTTFFQAPGRMNVFSEHPFKVIMDYAHNAHAVAVMADLAQRLDAGRRIVVVAGPGDRRDEDLREIANAVAGKFDHYICRRDDSLRGRDGDEVPRIIATALRAAGVAEAAITAIPDEQQAVDAALRMGRPGDLVLVFADALTRSWKQIIRFKPDGDMPAATARIEVPQLETTLDEQLVAAMEGVVRDERGLRFEREESD